MRAGDGRPVRWGVAGTGGIATRFAAALAQVPEAVPAAVCSRDLARAEAFAAAHGFARAHGRYEDLAADGDLDVVYVATPHARHHDDTLLFLGAGHPVLCEKPLALDRAQAERMVDGAEAAGLFLMEALWSRTLPAYRELEVVLAEGRIGTPTLVEADFGFTARRDPAHRLFDPALGGGALLDLGIYPLTLATLALGPVDEIAAQAVIGATGVDETTAVVARHGDALSVLKASITAPMTCTARIAGTAGTVDVPAFMHCPDRFTVTTAAGVEVVDAPVGGEGLRHEVEEVHRCLAAGLAESPLVPWADSLTVASTLDRVRAAVGLRYPHEPPG